MFSRSQRDFIRKSLGKDVIFFILHLSDECNKKRLQHRHSGVATEDALEMFDMMLKLYESAGEDEENAHDIIVTEDMSPEDVSKKVLDILEK